MSHASKLMSMGMCEMVTKREREQAASALAIRRTAMAHLNLPDAVKRAIEDAGEHRKSVVLSIRRGLWSHSHRLLFFLPTDPYRRQGTAYLHVRDDRNHNDPHPENPSGAVVVPISLATTFQQSTPGLATAKDDPNSFGMGYEYSRTGNPTRGAFERAVATAENAKYCVAFASGSAATSAVVHLLKQGDHVPVSYTHLTLPTTILV